MRNTTLNGNNMNKPYSAAQSGSGLLVVITMLTLFMVYVGLLWRMVVFLQLVAHEHCTYTTSLYMTRSILYCGITLAKNNFDQIKEQLLLNKKLVPIALGTWPSGKADDTDKYYAFIELSDHSRSAIMINAYVMHGQRMIMNIRSALDRRTVMNNDRPLHTYTLLNEQINK